VGKLTPPSLSHTSSPPFWRIPGREWSLEYRSDFDTALWCEFQQEATYSPSA
jgi:hypothetical protein